jgi:hypothetical protein
MSFINFTLDFWASDYSIAASAKTYVINVSRRMSYEEDVSSMLTQPSLRVANVIVSVSNLTAKSFASCVWVTFL